MSQKLHWDGKDIVVRERPAPPLSANKPKVHEAQAGIVLTTHALERAEERFGWNDATTRRMAQKAMDLGLPFLAARGALKDHLISLAATPETRIYGHHVFCFSGHLLVTVYPLPAHLVPHVKKQLGSGKKS